MSTVDNLSERLELLQGTLEVLILRSLQIGPNHAYGIGQFIEHNSESEFLVDNGSLYPALQRLLLNDWVKAEWGASENNRRARYYTITAAGRKQLDAERRELDRMIFAIKQVLES